MKNLFTPIFLGTLAMLALVHHLDIIGYEIVHSLLIFFIVAALVFYYFKKYTHGYILIALAIVLLITGQFIKEKETFYQIIETTATIPDDRAISLFGQLKDYPEIHPDHSVIFLHAYNLEYQQKKIAVSFNVRIEVNGNLVYLNRGDHIIIDTRMYRNTGNKNVFTNPIENLLLLKRTHFNSFCKSAQLITLAAPAPWFWRVIGTWRNQIRQTIEKKYRNNTTPSVEESVLDKKGVLLLAMLLGDRGELEDLQKEQLINAGIYHLLAISGAHIGIIAIGCLALLKLVNVSFRKRYILTALVLIVFLVLSGFKISAERAVIMAILIFIAKILYLDVDIYNIISFCGVILLARNPAEFLDAGFILTFALTVTIVIGRRIFLPLFKLTRWKMFREERSYLGETLSANLSAAIIALPLSLYFFKRYSFSGFFAGLLLVPLTAVILGLGFLLIPLAPLSAVLSQYLLIVIDPLLNLFFYISYIFSDVVDLTIYRAAPPFALVLFVLISFACLPVCRSWVQKISAATIVLLLCVWMSLSIFFYTPANLEVFFLDVGQGDSQVIVFPGGDALLIDGGGVYYSDFQVGRNIVLPFLLQQRIHIRWVAVSHYHADHIRGLTEILRILKPEELWLASDTPEDPLYQALRREVPSSTTLVWTTAPRIKKVGGCTIQWFFPTQVITDVKPHNNHSQVLKISDPHHSFLFTGDIEKEVESQLVNTECSNLQVDVLKVPHHGSATSSSPEFLKCTTPRLAVFSYGQGNRFGFPHKKVISNYKQQNIPYIATAPRGGIHLVSLPRQLKIETSK